MHIQVNVNVKYMYIKTKWATAQQNQMIVRPAKTQISPGIRPVWSESPLCTQWVAKDPSFL